MLVQPALVAFGATLAAAVQPLEVKGNQFVNPSTGNAFKVVGVAYQPGGSAGYDPSHGRDPLSDSEVCMRDAALMQSLGANTIRVYNLDPNLNHDECASIFNAAGMYMLIDVNSPLPGEALVNFEPWTSYYAAYLNRTFAVVEGFKNYPNTLAFFSGNEVISDEKVAAQVPPYVRAVTRDLKNYIKNHSKRQIPVGYSAADVRVVLEDSWNYFQCAIDGKEDDMSRADIFALNSYSWCGDSSFKEASYDQLVTMFQKSSIPVFFSEFGCNTPSPRIFTEIQSIYGPDMTGTFAGGVVYEYTQEDNDFGLAEINTDDQSIKLRDDFRALQKQYAKVDFSSVQNVKAASTSNPAPECKASLIKNEGFNSNFTLPVLPPGAQEIIDGGVSPAPVGKIVDISDWKVSSQVKDVDGSVISDLAVKPLEDDAVNTPGSNTGGSVTSAGSTSGAETSDGTTDDGQEDGAEGAAVRFTNSLAIPVVAALAIAGIQLI
ncbi:Glycolipid anchored surface protein 4 precursor [Diatrype stigma]|uniref:1,3-beta-glucanosyltransferase n=1 Tax=Diatrype stigma TaxID=117547 RepID=A0AAN9UT75_9PEZI